MTQEDLLRKIIELAVQSGKSLQKAETGFIHYHPQELCAVSIPIYENILFALALLRTKKIEHIQEAKVLLERLLHFQQMSVNLENCGNFPQYLHEYPHCRDHFLGIRLLIPFFWIKKDFKQILGENLAKRLDAAYEKLETFCLGLQMRLQLPAWAKFMLGITDQTPEGMNPVISGEILSAMQMRGIENNKKIDSEFWHFLETSWHAECMTYIGPAVKQVQIGYEPACTLYDYYLGYFSGALSEHAMRPQLAALQAVLIHPTTRQLAVKDTSHRQDNWIIHKEKAFGLSIITSSEKGESSVGSYPFYFVTKEHTLALDIPKGALTEWTCEEANNALHCELTCELADDILVDNVEKAVACSFFIDATPGVDITIGGRKGTSFAFTDQVEIVLHSVQITLKWMLLEGDGLFVGHINRANRPSQMLTKGKDRFTAYDWQLFLRGVRSTDKSRIKISLSISHVV